MQLVDSIHTKQVKVAQIELPYALLYKTRFVFFTPFFTAVFIVERLVLQTINVLNKEILQFMGLQSAVYNQERVIMARVRYVLSMQPFVAI